jgi:hypothetical protein
MPKIAELLVLPPVLFPFSQLTVPDPHPDLRSQKQIQVREKWLMAGYIISGDTAVLTESRVSLRRSMQLPSAETQAQLDGCPWSGAETAKCSEWIQRLRQMI